MRTTTGVFEAYAELFVDMPDDVKIVDSSIDITVKSQYIVGFLTVYSEINDRIMSDEEIASLGAKELPIAQVRKYAAMDTAEFAKTLYDIATQKGKYSRKSSTIRKYLTRAIYLYIQVSDYIERQNTIFARISQNLPMNALASINSGKVEALDNRTHEARIIVSNVTFEIEGYAGKISTAALMLNDMFLYKFAETGIPSLAIPLRDIAEWKGKSTDRKSIYKLRIKVLEWMNELSNISYRCKELINGKWIESGTIKISGGTAFIENGIVHWNYNQDLSTSLARLAEMDYPRELWRVDPRTSQFYFGRYIAQNYRINEGKKGRERISIRTLIEKSPNLPTYEEVMKGNRNVTDRIVKKTFSDLDELDFLFYTVETQDGTEISNPETLDYNSFINAFIVVDYSDFPLHTKRIARKEEHQQRIKNAKARQQARLAAKAASEAET